MIFRYFLLFLFSFVFLFSTSVFAFGGGHGRIRKWYEQAQGVDAIGVHYGDTTPSCKDDEELVQNKCQKKCDEGFALYEEQCYPIIENQACRWVIYKDANNISIPKPRGTSCNTEKACDGAGNCSICTGPHFVDTSYTWDGPKTVCIPCSTPGLVLAYNGKDCVEKCANTDNPREISGSSCVDEYDCVPVCPDGQFRFNEQCSNCDRLDAVKDDPYNWCYVAYISQEERRLYLATLCARCENTDNTPRKIFQGEYCGRATCPSGYMHDSVGNCVPCDTDDDIAGTKDECDLCHRTWNEQNNTCQISTN